MPSQKTQHTTVRSTEERRDSYERTGADSVAPWRAEQEKGEESVPASTAQKERKSREQGRAAAAAEPSTPC